MRKVTEVIPFPEKSQTKREKTPHRIISSNSFQSSNTHAPFNTEQTVSFYRLELNLILSYYGRMVAKGEWRDYAIDMRKDSAIFSIFKHTSERPLFRVEKHPKLARKQGAFRIISSTGQILKRGHDLGQVLKIFEKKIEVVSG